MLYRFSFGDPNKVAKIINSDLISYSIEDSSAKSVTSSRTEGVTVQILLQHVKVAKGPQEVAVRRRLYPGEERTAVLGSARCVFWNVSLGYRFTTQIIKHGGKGKVHPRTGHEGPEVEQRYSSTLSLTSLLEGWVVNARPRLLYPLERPGTYCIRGWVGPRVGLDGCGKSRPHLVSIPRPSSL